jgi:glyoxylase-like metal-dependent hydrolase (beta-lactamase superfamily II)
MTDFLVLAEGYVRKKEGTLYSSSTIVLLQDSGLTVIVDPGLDRQLLCQSIEKWDISPEDVQYVVLTHSHPDHSLMTGIFEKAKTIDGTYMYSYDGGIVDSGDRIPKTEIELLFTPGHDITDCSLVINTHEYGKVAIVGDVLWWSDGEEQETTLEALIKREDAYAYNMENLILSRKRILEQSDWIIPGHGKMFHVPR